MSYIEFDNVNLRFPIRENIGITLKEFIVRGMFQKQSKQTKSVHALKDISLRIVDGERVGIIGANGSGKSTLLRTLGCVYPIESGRRNIVGSICSLLEITCGFELQATGIDNIYYRSYLQGETPKSVKEKIEEISAFSELGEFLHLPVRCYSSGMMTRLAFSIVTSSEPDILLIDEVFSTGDLSFQGKAEKRMQSFMNRANIVVMVGHDLSFIEKFCSRVIWVDKGHIRMDDSPLKVVAAYRHDVEARQAA